MIQLKTLFFVNGRFVVTFLRIFGELRQKRNDFLKMSADWSQTKEDSNFIYNVQMENFKKSYIIYKMGYLISTYCAYQDTAVQYRYLLKT